MSDIEALIRSEAAKMSRFVDYAPDADARAYYEGMVKGLLRAAHILARETELANKGSQLLGPLQPSDRGRF
jgi:hypothetical protein